MNFVIVVAPASSWGRYKGFRHAVIPGQERALCGVDVTDWQGDVRTLDPVPFEEGQVGCRNCQRVFEARYG